MGAIADLDTLTNLITGGGAGAPETVWWSKDSRVAAAAAAATVAGRWTSLWSYNGQPSDGATPGAAANPTNATSGALKQTDAGGGRQKWLLSVAAGNNVAGTLILYDRLLHNGGLSGTTTTAQTVGGTLSRSTSGVGNVMWAEIYTAVGATATTITCSYTNEVPTSGRTSQATPFGGTGSNEAQRVIPLPLAQGDWGVTAVANITVLASTLTAGSFGVTIANPFVVIPLGVVGMGGIRDLITTAAIMPIEAGACLAWLWHANGTTAPILMGHANFVEV